MFLGLQPTSLFTTQSFKFQQPKAFLFRGASDLDFFQYLALACRILTERLDLGPQGFLLDGELLGVFINFHSQSLQLANTLNLLLDVKPSLLDPLLLLNGAPASFLFQFTEPAFFFFRAQAGGFNKRLLLYRTTMRFLFDPDPGSMFSLQARVLLATSPICFLNLFLSLLARFLKRFLLALLTRLSLLNGFKLFLAARAQRFYFYSDLLLFGGSLLGFLFVLLAKGLQLRQPTVFVFGPEPGFLLATQSVLANTPSHLFEAATFIICSHFHFRFERETFLLCQAAGFFLNLDALARFNQFDYFCLRSLARQLHFCSDLRQLITCSLKGLMFGTQSLSFRAMVRFSFRAQPFDSFEGTFMFFGSALLFECLTLQFF
jgi:hypothetical protein